LEAHSQDTTEAEGVLHSLHSFGFDNLALSVQQTTSVGGGGIFGSANMSYHLGWRTETWDLPEQTGGHRAGAGLYQALRAVYRERDPRAIDVTVEAAIMEEMNRLRCLGDENLVGIHETIQSLLCLTQVKQWRSNHLQDGLQMQKFDLSGRSEFCEIDGEFECVFNYSCSDRFPYLISSKFPGSREHNGDSHFLASFRASERTASTDR